MSEIRVAVCGSGQMGRMVLETVEAQEGMAPVGVIEPMHDTSPTGEFVSAAGLTYPLLPDAGLLFAETRPDVVVDFTNAAFTGRLCQAALSAGVRPVIGTSGVDDATLRALRDGCAAKGLGGVVAANFAVGAVLLMHMANIASRFFDAAEIIELHHDRKVDAPSGTALTTARGMREARGSDFTHNEPSLQHIDGARGAAHGGVGIHSVRLPGFVASQEVVFGGQGQTLSLRHDSTGRDSFMPGVVLAIREVMQRDQLVEGLDALIGLR